MPRRKQAPGSSGDDTPKPPTEAASDAPRKPRRRGNSLDGRRWLQNSISVWGDIRKSPEELRLKHPAMFPSMLAERLIESFLPEGDHLVLDPFAGTGSTLVAAERLQKRSVGFEISASFADLAEERISQLAAGAQDLGEVAEARGAKVIRDSATTLSQHLDPSSVDLCITSPPYWNILNQKRTADYKAIRHYGNSTDDLGTIDDYGTFLDALAGVFQDVLALLKPRAHCCIVVMDLRKRDQFFPFHSDLAQKLQQVGYRYDDLIVWNRQTEYNNLRPLGYPSVFRINKVHEFVLLMQKPAG